MRWSEKSVAAPRHLLATDPRLAQAVNASRSGTPPLIRISQTAHNSALTHLSTLTFEQGGLLLGRLFEHTPGGAIVALCIDEVVPASDGIGTEVALTMPTTVWDAARKRLRSDQVVIGWYHSHPNLGAFFSSTDRSTQAAFFHHPYSLGWVIDPVNNEEALFLGPRCESVDWICAD
jgi:proteasome lid subunit RPN8/RPN11